MIQNGGIITVTEKDAEYLLRYMTATGAPTNPVRAWQTTICPECGDIPTPARMGGYPTATPYTHIVDADGFVLIGCEGYWVINPARLGMPQKWIDWHSEIGNDDNPPDPFFYN